MAGHRSQARAGCPRQWHQRAFMVGACLIALMAGSTHAAPTDTARRNALARIAALDGAMPESFDINVADPCAGEWVITGPTGEAYAIATVMRYRGVALLHLSTPDGVESNSIARRTSPTSIEISGAGIAFRCAGGKAIAEFTPDGQPKLILNAHPRRTGENLPPPAPPKPPVPAVPLGDVFTMNDPDRVPLLCLDSAGAYQPFQRTDFGSLRVAMQNRYALDWRLTESSPSAGSLTFRGGVQGKESITFTVASRGSDGLALLSMKVRLLEERQSLTGNEMCFRTKSIVGAGIP